MVSSEQLAEPASTRIKVESKRGQIQTARSAGVIIAITLLVVLAISALSQEVLATGTLTMGDASESLGVVGASILSDPNIGIGEPVRWPCACDLVEGEPETYDWNVHASPVELGLGSGLMWHYPADEALRPGPYVGGRIFLTYRSGTQEDCPAWHIDPRVYEFLLRPDGTIESTSPNYSPDLVFAQGTVATNERAAGGHSCPSAVGPTHGDPPDGAGDQGCFSETVWTLRIKSFVGETTGSHEGWYFQHAQFHGSVEWPLDGGQAYIEAQDPVSHSCPNPDSCTYSWNVEHRLPVTVEYGDFTRTLEGHLCQSEAHSCLEMKFDCLECPQPCADRYQFASHFVPVNHTTGEALKWKSEQVIPVEYVAVYEVPGGGGIHLAAVAGGPPPTGLWPVTNPTEPVISIESTMELERSDECEIDDSPEFAPGGAGCYGEQKQVATVARRVTNGTTVFTLYSVTVTAPETEPVAEDPAGNLVQMVGRPDCQPDVWGDALAYEFVSGPDPDGVEILVNQEQCEGLYEIDPCFEYQYEEYLVRELRIDPDVACDETNPVRCGGLNGFEGPRANSEVCDEQDFFGVAAHGCGPLEGCGEQGEEVACQQSVYYQGYEAGPHGWELQIQAEYDGSSGDPSKCYLRPDGTPEQAEGVPCDPVRIVANDAEGQGDGAEPGAYGVKRCANEDIWYHAYYAIAWFRSAIGSPGVEGLDFHRIGADSLSYRLDIDKTVNENFEKFVDSEGVSRPMTFTPKAHEIRDCETAGQEFEPPSSEENALDDVRVCDPADRDFVIPCGEPILEEPIDGSGVSRLNYIQLWFHREAPQPPDVPDRPAQPPDCVCGVNMGAGYPADCVRAVAQRPPPAGSEEAYFCLDEPKGSPWRGVSWMSGVSHDPVQAGLYFVDDNSSPQGGVVVLPQNDWTVDNGLRIPAATELCGSGKQTTKVELGSGISSLTPYVTPYGPGAQVTNIKLDAQGNAMEGVTSEHDEFEVSCSTIAGAKAKGFTVPVRSSGGAASLNKLRNQSIVVMAPGSGDNTGKYGVVLAGNGHMVLDTKIVMNPLAGSGLKSTGIALRAGATNAVLRGNRIRGASYGIDVLDSRFTTVFENCLACQADAAIGLEDEQATTMIAENEIYYTPGSDWLQRRGNPPWAVPGHNYTYPVCPLNGVCD